MNICRSTTGKCAARTVVALGAVALFSMGAAGADQADGLAKSVDFNRAVRVQGPGSVDITRATFPAVLNAPARSAVAEGVFPCTQPDANCQLADQGGHGEAGIIGATSDAVPGFHVIEGFRNETGGSLTITEVCWTGFYLDFDAGVDCNLSVPTDNFTITLFTNSPSCPVGEPNLAQAQVTVIGNTAIKAATAFMVGGNQEFEYSAQGLSIGPVSIDACYWIGVQNNTPDTPEPSCFWLWSTAPGNGNSYQDGAGVPVNDFDHAVCLNAPLGDTSACGIVEVWPLGCPDALGNCYEANPEGGCNDPCCCTLVCQPVIQGGQGLDFCCEFEWDQGCADVAIEIGCTFLPPLPLCCATEMDCMDEIAGKPVTQCQVYTQLNAFNSTGDPGIGDDLFHAADDFQVTEAGNITSLCFQGAYGAAATTDDFVVTIYDDVDGLPGNVIGTASQLGGTLTIDARRDTNLTIADLGATIVWQYTTTINPGIAVVPDTCYWLEIVNNIAPAETWFWEWAEPGSGSVPGIPDAEPEIARQGNGRCVVDGGPDGLPPDGYDFFGDTAPSNDLAFCMNLELATPACGFSDMGTDTGPHEFCLFNGGDSHLGWSSGDLDAGPGVDDQRRTVQAFTVPALPAGPPTTWSIEHILLEGFDPGAVTNQFLNFRIFNRTALDVAPTDADIVQAFDLIEFGGGFDDDTEEFGIIAQGVFLDPGDYWLTFFASNDSKGAIPSNIAWFTNAPFGTNNACTINMPPPAAGYLGCTPSDPVGMPPGTPAMLRARLYPVPGYGGYTLTAAVLDLSPLDPTPDPEDLYNAAFRVRMRAVVPPVLCPFDCEEMPDGDVGINDFLALLGQWAIVDAPCDIDGGGVDIDDFLGLLGSWGPCP